MGILDGGLQSFAAVAGSMAQERMSQAATASKTGAGMPTVGEIADELEQRQAERAAADALISKPPAWLPGERTVGRTGT